MTEQKAIEIIKREEQWESNSSISKAFNMAIEALEEVEQYRAIGTPEECRAAVEKQRAIKPHKNFDKFSGVWCSCGSYLGQGYFVDKPNYCSDCGQKLDWSEEQ